MPDKMSQEKIALLRAYGAEVVITPTAVRAGEPRVLLPGRRPADRGDPRRVPAEPVLQPRQPRGALRHHRPGDLGADRRRDGRAGRRRGDRRNDQRDRSLPEGAEAFAARRRRGPRGFAVLRGARRGGAPLPDRGHRRGLLARDVRPVRGGPLGPRIGPGFAGDRPRADPPGGDPGRRVVRDRAVRRADGRPGTAGRDADGRDPPGHGAELPVEALQRLVDAPVRVPRPPGAGPRRGGPGREARRSNPAAGHDRRARQGAAGGRPAAGVRHLTGAGRARRRRLGRDVVRRLGARRRRCWIGCSATRTRCRPTWPR